MRRWPDLSEWVDLLQLGRSQHVDSLVDIDLVIDPLALIEQPDHSLRPRLVEPVEISRYTSFS